MVTQQGSKVMVKIGETTKSDSTAMKTVAVVTMVFASNLYVGML